MGFIFVGCGREGKAPIPRGFTKTKQKISVAPLFCFIPVYFSVAAERNSELSVSAGVGVVLRLFCLFLVSLIFISRCLNVLGWARIISSLLRPRKSNNV